MNLFSRRVFLLVGLPLLLGSGFFLTGSYTNFDNPRGENIAPHADEGMIGEIRIFAGTFAPRGWAFCQGQTMSIGDNAALYSILGTFYGGDGRTSFALPDLRGRAAVGLGQGPGLETNWTLGLAAGQQQTNVRSIEVWTASAELAQGRNFISNDVNSVSTVTTQAPSLGLNYIICTEGIYPSRN